MANEDDECDSSSLFTVATQSDINSFLHAQSTKITGLNSSISDDDENSIDDNLLRSFTRNNHSKIVKPCLSHSCFASISTQKQNHSDDLTELKWLNTFKFKEFQDKKNSNDDQISKLSNELKLYNKQNSTSYGVLIFHALYSKHDDKQIPWSLTIKQLYEYIQSNFKQITNKRGWKNLLKQTLITIPCFIKTKYDIPKSHSIWTIDPYYRPLLTKAYLTSLELETNKIISDEKQSESIVNNFAPKATVKTKALPRLYERLCEEKADDEADSNQIIKHQRNAISDHKRPRSVSSTGSRQFIKDKNEKRPSSLNKRPKTSTLNKISSPKKRIKPTESSIIEDDECDSNHSIRKSIITTRSQTIARNIKNRRKSSPPKKRLSLSLSTHRPNTRINKKIIEQDLELLRQAQPIDLTSNKILPLNKPPIEDILDLSLSR